MFRPSVQREWILCSRFARSSARIELRAFPWRHHYAAIQLLHREVFATSLCRRVEQTVPGRPKVQLHPGKPYRKRREAV